MVYSALSDDSSTVSQFTRRKKITITTGGTSTPTNYQCKLTITYESEMEVSFADVRFNTKAGAYIDMWQESHTDSTTADIWVELLDAITDPGSDYIYMYYGNASLSDGSVGADTFLFFDDFSGDLNAYNITGTPTIVSGELKITGTGAWNANGVASKTGFALPFIMEWDARYSTSTIDSMEGVGTSGTLAFTLGAYNYKQLGGNIYRYINAVGTDTGTIYVITKKHSKIVFNSTTSAMYYNSTSLGSDAFSNSPLYPQFQVHTNAKISYIDDIIIRKYIANEPTPSYGTAQHQRRIPRFL